jgi:hypothetical protein
MKRPIPLIAVLLVLWGCGDPSSPTRSLSIVVGKPSYSLTADKAAEVSLTNTSGVDVFFPMNTYVECERLVGEEWTFGARWFELDGVGPSIRVPAGTTVRDAMGLKYLPDTGTYRFRYLVFADQDAREPVDLSDRVSAVFTVVK